MPVYEYSGVNASGKKVRGVFDADNPRALRDGLRAQSIFVTEFFEGKKAEERRKGDVQIRLPWTGGVSLRDVSIMTRQLATLQKAGIPLVESLQALVDQTEDEGLKRIISVVRQKVNEGSALALALSEHPKAFSDLYVNMIRAGESSGNLDVVLLRLADFLDDQIALRAKVSGALVYPIIMICLGTGIVGFLLAFVVPQITQIYADQQAALPLPTAILLSVSDLIVGWWWLLGALVVLGVHGFRKWKATADGRDRWDTAVLKLPIFGPLLRMIAVARFAKTLATLLASGVPVLTALDIVKNILGNVVLIRVVEQARLNIREGESIATPLRRSGEFPPLVTHMIAVGERTGALESMLDNVSESYAQQVSMRVQAMTTLLEPLIIVGMGVVVGFIVFAILMPILQLNQAMGTV